jgi:hypothetical protein
VVFLAIGEIVRADAVAPLERLSAAGADEAMLVKFLSFERRDARAANRFVALCALWQKMPLQMGLAVELAVAEA